jgi:hypothetical protein
MVKHVAHHGHADLRPLAHPAEVRMVELRHGTVTCRQCAKEGQNSVCTDAMPLSDLGNDVLTFGGEFRHDGTGPMLVGGIDEQAPAPDRT